jgi:hypothetical protein
LFNSIQAYKYRYIINLHYKNFWAKFPCFNQNLSYIKNIAKTLIWTIKYKYKNIYQNEKNAILYKIINMEKIKFEVKANVLYLIKLIN